MKLFVSLTKDLINHVTADSNHGSIIIYKLPRSDSLIVNPQSFSIILVLQSQIVKGMSHDEFYYSYMLPALNLIRA